MADEPKVLFEVDASKILAKLHLAGIQAISLEKDEFFVNSGIKNDDPTNAKPDNPGKVEFDLTNAQGEYEAGFVGSFSYERSFEVQHKLDQLSKIFSQEADKKLVDDLKDKNKEVEKEKQQIIDDIKDSLGIDIKSLDDIKKAQAEVKEKLKDDEDDYNEKLATIKKHAAEALKKYFTVFAGEDKAKGITEDSMIMINIMNDVKDSNDKRLVTNFEIRPMSDKDKAVMLKKFQANPKDCEEKVCFKVGYTIELDK